jgi:hypothetical protein
LRPPFYFSAATPLLGPRRGCPRRHGGFQSAPRAPSRASLRRVASSSSCVERRIVLLLPEKRRQSRSHVLNPLVGHPATRSNGRDGSAENSGVASPLPRTPRPGTLIEISDHCLFVHFLPNRSAIWVTDARRTGADRHEHAPNPPNAARVRVPSREPSSEPMEVRLNACPPARHSLNPIPAEFQQDSPYLGWTMRRGRCFPWLDKGR